MRSSGLGIGTTGYEQIVASCDPVRTGVIPSRTTPARIDRLKWQSPKLRRGARRVHLRGGTMATRPSAVGVLSNMFEAIEADGSPAWVRVTTSDTAPQRARDHEAARDLVSRLGVTLPSARRVTDHVVWLERYEWSETVPPSPTTVSWFVESALKVALEHGAVVALGEPHLLNDGAIVVEDAGIAAVLEVDERVAIARACHALVEGLPVDVVHAVSDLCRERVPGVAAAAQRATLALAVDWTPASFGLSLHHVAMFATRSGGRAMSLRLLADELLHRLDLAHRFPSGVTAFADRAAAHRVLMAGSVSR